jgi:hypothetical protein
MISAATRIAMPQLIQAHVQGGVFQRRACNDGNGMIVHKQN